MKILIVDGRDDIRIEWFTNFCNEVPEIHIVKDSLLARKSINKFEYDYVFLDQDLEEPDAGIHVVNFIAMNLQDKKDHVPKNVIIHSLSGKGSHEMELILMRAAYKDMRILRRPYFHNQELYDFVRSRL